MDTQRFVWALLFSFSLLMLWQGWEKEKNPAQHAAVAEAQPRASVAEGATAAGVPSVTALDEPGRSIGADAVPGASGGRVAPSITVETDVLKATISAEGGTVTRIEMKKQKATGNSNADFVLLQGDSTGHDYVAESGLIGDGLPNHKTLFKLPGGDLSLASGADEIKVRLSPVASDGVSVSKIFTFHRNSYLIEVSYEMQNGSSAAVNPYAYFQFVRDGLPQEEGEHMGSSVFTGPAVYTEAGKYEKVEFKDVDKGEAKYPTKAQDGWIAMVQHYFVAAWLPQGGVSREFFIRKVSDKLYAMGTIVPVGSIAPGGEGRVTVPLYVGPQDQNKLKAIAPGLDLVANYGWLTVIALPLYWVLEWIERIVGNWGWAIIVLTILIKLAFFPLSAASYRSMARMRVLTPKMAKLKEQFSDDKARLNQEMMELYKKEKINPLGGCLPVLVQIPVFIALYSVLLGTIELRHAPWILWISDLSAKDPYYVLPLIMGASMMVQMKLNPTPPDPVQAKVMMIMPVVFTGMFLFFPSGLVLYWIVNNLLSIAQQWQITRLAESGQGAEKSS